MFDTDISTLDADATLTEAASVQTTANLVEARRLQIAAHWADLHGVLTDSSALPGAERMVCLGGDGTPEVAEFAPAELGAVAGESTGAATNRIADALDLRHRHPLLWPACAPVR